MSNESPAVAIARSHVEAWARYHFETLTVEIDGPPFGQMDLPGSRLYLIDENGKITEEHVIFFGAPA